MTDYYETNLQHISEELKRIDLMIHLQVDMVDGFQGLYISDEEINSILDDTYPTNDDDQHIQTLNSLIAEIETQIEEKVIESQKKGIALNLPLWRLSSVLHHSRSMRCSSAWRWNWIRTMNDCMHTCGTMQQ